MRGEQPSGVSLLRNIRAAIASDDYEQTWKKGNIDMMMKMRWHPKRSSQWPPLNAASPEIILQIILCQFNFEQFFLAALEYDLNLST